MPEANDSVPGRMPIRADSRLLLKITALFAMFWVVARACVQAITIDEAVAYSNFALPTIPSHWVAHSANHVLNSALMRLFTSVFGASHLTVRAGAVIGAAVYIYTAHRLSRLIGRDSRLQWALFVCLAFNPLILDFLVASRGYSLAVAFLACAIGVVAWNLGEDTARGRRSLVGACALSSVCAALSFSANFAFAFVDAGAVVMVFLWACFGGPAAGLPRRERIAERARLLAASVLPGLLGAAYLVGSALMHWRDVQLVYGAKSLRETLASLSEASFYQPNPYVVSPLVLEAVQKAAPYILPLLGAFCVWRLTLILLHRSSPRGPHARWLLALGTVAAGAGVLAIAGHELLFHLFGVLLPKDRTAVYLVFLITLLMGILAAVPVPSRAGGWSRRGLAFLLFVLAGYYLCCLRLTYFKEWKWDSDVDRVYSVLAYYNHTCGIRDVPVNWRYDASLNFYQELSRRENFSEFQSITAYPAGRKAYVFYYPEDREYIETHGLNVVYLGESGAAVALNPAAQGDHPCETALPRTGIRW